MRMFSSFALRSDRFNRFAAKALGAGLLSVTLCFSALGVNNSAVPVNAGTARIHFATETVDLGKVPALGAAHGAFSFTNLGTAPLELFSLHAECGCTAATNWSRQVAPGQTGTIPFDYHAPDFKGPTDKTLTVACNDPTRSNLVLHVKATIWKPIETIPPYAILRAVTGATESVTTSIRIVSNLDAPLQLSPPESTNRYFATELKTIQPGREFELVVSTVPPLPSHNPQQFILIRTSARETPQISVPTVAISEPLLVVSPTVLVLPANPLKQPTRFDLFVRNNATTPLQLSEPMLGYEDSSQTFTNFTVEITEPEPGRQFALSLTLPAGLEIPAGQKLQLKVKTSDVKNPELKIPWCIAPCL